MALSEERVSGRNVLFLGVACEALRCETEGCCMVSEPMAYLLCGVLFVAISFGIVVLDDLTGHTWIRDILSVLSRV